MISGFVVISILYSSCSKSVYKDITCRAFSLTQEQYWFPNSVGDSITFVNSSNAKKKFNIANKEISHTSSYANSSGCSCIDISGMILTSNTDSIWFNNGNEYLENDAAKNSELVAFVLSNVFTEFSQIQKTTVATLTINNVTFTNVKKFEGTYTNNLNVKTVYMVKDLGIIRFEMVSGEIWTNTNLTNINPTNQSSFSYSEKTCE